MSSIVRLLFLIASLVLSACAQSTKDWHRASAAKGSPTWDWYLRPGDPPLVQRPPRGPLVSALRLSSIRTGDSGDRIYDATRRQHLPFYDGDLAFVTTRIFGCTYEVAFRYLPDRSGRIADISYLPVRE